MCFACEMGFWIDEPPPAAKPKPKRKAARTDNAFACDTPDAPKPARKRPAASKPRTRKASPKKSERRP
jgi:hypothetical protein